MDRIGSSPHEIHRICQYSSQHRTFLALDWLLQLQWKLRARGLHSFLAPTAMIRATTAVLRVNLPPLHLLLLLLLMLLLLLLPLLESVHICI